MHYYSLHVLATLRRKRPQFGVLLVAASQEATDTIITVSKDPTSSGLGCTYIGRLLNPLPPFFSFLSSPPMPNDSRSLLMPRPPIRPLTSPPRPRPFSNCPTRPST